MAGHRFITMQLEGIDLFVWLIPNKLLIRIQVGRLQQQYQRLHRNQRILLNQQSSWKLIIEYSSYGSLDDNAPKATQEVYATP